MIHKSILNYETTILYNKYSTNLNVGWPFQIKIQLIKVAEGVWVKKQDFTREHTSSFFLFVARGLFAGTVGFSGCKDEGEELKTTLKLTWVEKKVPPTSSESESDSESESELPLDSSFLGAAALAGCTVLALLSWQI
jgi:hypothetical protein